MGFFKRLLSKQVRKDPLEDLTPAARDFLEGKSDTLSSSDVDREGTERYETCLHAMRLKEAGDLRAAAELLERSCNPPSIYKGHYRDLFKIWRQINRDDLKESRHDLVIKRVMKIVRYDDEMIKEMLSYWGEHGWDHPPRLETGDNPIDHGVEHCFTRHAAPPTPGPLAPAWASSFA
jgi:hypothetical protein